MTEKMLQLVVEFCVKKHKNQKRKSDGRPYIFHPFAVATLYCKYKKSTNMLLLLACCLLHDVVEDCGITLAEIARRFGHSVASIVEELTSDPEKIEELGKTKYLSMKMYDMSTYALGIKLADRLHNISDMTHEHPDDWEYYRKQTMDILKYIKYRKLTSTHKKLIKAIKRRIKKHINK